MVHFYDTFRLKKCSDKFMRKLVANRDFRKLHLEMFSNISFLHRYEDFECSVSIA